MKCNLLTRRYAIYIVSRPLLTIASISHFLYFQFNQGFHSSQVCLPLPLSFTPLTSKLLHAENQSSLSYFFLSSSPNHCSLFCLTTSVMHSMPSRLLSSVITFCAIYFFDFNSFVKLYIICIHIILFVCYLTYLINLISSTSFLVNKK